MKGRMIVGALVLSVALSSQGFGFELLGNLLRLEDNKGCTPCGEVIAHCPDPCTPVEDCGWVCDPCARKPLDLFAGLRGLFACHRCPTAVCADPCTPAAVCTPEPCTPVAVCTPEPCTPVAACEAVPSCEPGFAKVACHRPLLGLLQRKPVCCPEPVAYDPGCEVACPQPCRRPVLDFLAGLLTPRPKVRVISCTDSVVGCNGWHVNGNGEPTAAPANGEPNGIEPAPKPDNSALMPYGHNVYQTSRAAVRN